MSGCGAAATPAGVRRVEAAEPVPGAAATGGVAGDAESRAWIAQLRGGGRAREQALARLHELLLRAASFEIARRAGAFGGTRAIDAEGLAAECADDALMSVLARLEDFRGESRFTTWAYKFALYEAAAKMRRLAWRGREIPLQDDGWRAVVDARASLERDAQTRELLGALRDAVNSELSPHQREVLVALALNGVPIDVLSERLGTSRGALYKTLHDARRKLRAALAAEGMSTEVIDADG